MAKKRTDGIVAIFSYLDYVCTAMEKIRGRGDFEGHEVLSPTSYHELEHAAGYSPSPVRWFTLTGALIGIFSGFALPLFTDYDWPLVVGGKTAGFYSFPVYIIFAFELMVLIGAICTIAGMLFMGRLPNPKGKIFDERTTDDKFAIFVPGASVTGPQAQLLKECGAEEINITN
jgi:molybdopterin-containing oxidoreductase family membrane subunit